jgi:uncharacterized protein (TIRG00374 family)
VSAATWLRAGVTVALTAFVAVRVDWGAFAERLESGRPGWFAAAVGLVAAALVIGALRWWQLLGAAGIRLDARQLGRVYTVSTFSSTFLPTSVGGDVARALLVAREPRLLVRVGATILVDRAGALLGMLALAWLGLLLQPGAASVRTQVALAVVTGAVVVAGAVALLAATRPSAAPARVRPARLGRALREVREVTAIYGRRPAVLVVLVGSSVLFQALVAAQLCALAESLGLSLSFAMAAVTLTLVTLATMIPLSIAGFGIREVSYVVVLAGAGIDATDATALSLATVVVLLLASLPGAVMLAHRGTDPVFP